MLLGCGGRSGRSRGMDRAGGQHAAVCRDHGLERRLRAFPNPARRRGRRGRNRRPLPALPCSSRTCAVRTWWWCRRATPSSRLFRAWGADTLINYRRTPQWGKAVRDEVGEADLVIELGGAETLGQALRAVRPGGTIALIGVLSGGKAELPLGPAITREVRLQSVTCGSRDDLRDMVRAIDASTIRPVIDRTYPFREFPDALDRLEAAQPHRQDLRERRGLGTSPARFLEACGHGWSPTPAPGDHLRRFHAAPGTATRLRVARGSIRKSAG